MTAPARQIVTGDLPLTVATITDGEFLKRSGSTIISAAGGSGDALTSNPLSQFAATTSAQLRGVMSDETGGGALVFAAAPSMSDVVITTSGAATIGLKITATAAQTANLIDVNSSTPTGIFKVDASGYVGIGWGTTALAACVDVNISSTSIYTSSFRQNYAGNTPARIRFVKTRNNGVVTSGDNIGEFNFLFHDGTLIRSMANFGVRSSGAPANNNSPCQMWFGCTPGWNSTSGYGDATAQLIFDGPSRCTTIGENIGTGGTAAQTSAVLGVTINTTTKKGVLIKGKASQTANLFEIQDSAAAELFGIGALGQMRVKSGSNQRIGQATLVAGTVTVNNTSVTANSRIFLSVSTVGGTQGKLSYTKVAATSFTITSDNGADTSVVDWFIVESV